MLLMVAGLTGSGKSSIASQLSKRLNVPYYSGSVLRSNFLGLVPEPHDAEARRAYWLSNADGIASENQRLSDETAESDFDSYLTKLHSTTPRGVFDVWFLPWHTTRPDPGITVWVDVPMNARVERIAIASRRTDIAQLSAELAAKDERCRDYGLKAFDVDIFVDRKPFDIVLSPGESDLEATVTAVEIFCRGYDSVASTSVIGQATTASISVELPRLTFHNGQHI